MHAIVRGHEIAPGIPAIRPRPTMSDLLVFAMMLAAALCGCLIVLG